MSAAPQPSRNAARPSGASGKIWFFRAFTALVIPIILLLLFEGGLRVVGFGRSTAFFIPDDQPGWLRTNPDYVSLFLPGDFELRPLNYRFREKKPANTVRVIVLGESAAQGIPVPAFGFAPPLRALLRARYPGKDVEVINTGVVAINSHVVYQIARDAARCSPDLFVVYLGNNEVVGPYGPGCSYLSDLRPLWAIRVGAWVRSTRTGQLVATSLAKLARLKKPAQEWGGMTMFVDHAVRGDDPRLEGVYRNFEANLRDIVRSADHAGARTLLCTVVSNLKDSAPFLSLHRTDLAEAERADWQRAFDAGTLAWKLGENAAARAALQEAWRIDPQYADTAFMLGSLELQAGQLPAARKYFLSAQQWDALRFRPVPRLNEITRNVARDNPQAVLVDTALELGSDPASTGDITGRELMLEHVHPDWAGNQRIARLMAEGAEQALFPAQPGRGPWLDAAGTAAAVGYTPAERFGVLQRITLITRNPPFTNQLTYAVDQARAARETAAAAAVRHNAAALQQASAIVGAAIRGDPTNVDLAKLDLELTDDLGDTPGALEKARRLQTLQPANYALATDVAIKLARLGQYAEAEELLRQTVRGTTTRELIKMGPAFVDFYTRTKRFADGRRWFDEVIARNIQTPALRLFRGRLAQAASDPAAAENDYRAVLDADPASEAALEYLVALLTERGQGKEAEDTCLRLTKFQSNNQANHLRAAQILEGRGDNDGAAQALQAAIRCGPVPVPVYLHLVNFLYGRKSPEALDYLATASRLSSDEGDAETTAAISELIRRIRAGQ